MIDFSDSFLTPKETDSKIVLIWKMCFKRDYVSIETLINDSVKFYFSVSEQSIKTTFYDLNKNFKWFKSRKRSSSDKRGPKGLEYCLRADAKHPRTKMLMVEFMQREFEKELILNEKERKEFLMDMLHSEPIEICGIKTTLKDTLYVYGYYKENSGELELQYRNNDTTHLYHLNGAKYSTAEIIRLSQYVKSNRLYTQFKSY